jgi:hypothetical protein
MTDNEDKEKKNIDEWQQRLSPVTNKRELTEEDKKIIKEQEETGKEIDKLYEYEKFLRENKKHIPIDDYRNILYYLPCDDETRKKIYNDLLEAENKKK